MASGIEVIREEIVKKSKEQYKTVIDGAKSEYRKIIKEAEKRIEEYKKKSDEETKQALLKIKKRELTTAELEAKKLELEAKKRQIEGVFDRVKRSILGLGDEQREAIIKKLLERASKEIDAKVFYCNKHDIKFVRGFDAKPCDIIGGLIAENSDKTIRIDYSFDTLLESIKEDYLQEISNILFS